MGVLALSYESDEKYTEICEYLNANNGYWIKNDVWIGENKAFKERSIYVKDKVKTWKIADFSTFKQDRLKNEMKYFILKQLSEGAFTAHGCSANYLRAIRNVGEAVSNYSEISFADMNPEEIIMDDTKASNTENKKFKELKFRILGFIKELYDGREGLERDRWYALQIPGVKLSAAIKRTKSSICFDEIPAYYRDSVKRYMKTLIYRRSWSFCSEVLVYIRYFYKSFYSHGYSNGFQENLTRIDFEKYLQWVSEDYENNNATFRSKAVSFIRNWLDFIQLAEFDVAPKKDVTKLIFDEDIPKRSVHLIRWKRLNIYRNR